MNGLILLLCGSALFLVGYAVYSKFIARVLGVDPSRPTPAHTQGDGCDYVPAHPTVLFGHHFAAIAGAGPIIGPVLASQFGWASVALWIVLGCIFIGSMHDMVTLFLSVRHQGKSIGSVIEDVLGRPGKMIFLMFCFAALVLVMSVFTGQVADAFVSNPEVATSSLLGIFEAALFGVCVYKFRWSVFAASFVFVPILFFLVWIGVVFPCDLTAIFGVTQATSKTIWVVVLFVYCFVASTLPVWLLLQPRDYLNSYLLYAMLAIGLTAVCIVRPPININAFSGFAVTAAKGGHTMYLFPLLFVTVACGACSGFHALVASGTTSKQLDSERHIRPVGYGCMLLEGVVALLALIAVAWHSQADLVAGLSGGKPVVLFAQGLASFCGKLGLPEKTSESFMLLAVAAFLMTSVDACTRLARFVWQELWSTASAAAPASREAAVADRPPQPQHVLRDGRGGGDRRVPAGAEPVDGEQPLDDVREREPDAGGADAPHGVALALQEQAQVLDCGPPDVLHDRDFRHGRVPALPAESRQVDEAGLRRGRRDGDRVAHALLPCDRAARAGRDEAPDRAPDAHHPRRHQEAVRRRPRRFRRNWQKGLLRNGRFYGRIWATLRGKGS